MTFREPQREANILEPGNTATPPRLLAEAIDYEALRDGLRARAAELGISRLDIDRVGRLSEGHSGRLLSRQSSRLFAIKSLGQILKALGARLLLVEDPETTARTRRLMGGQRNEAYVRDGNHWRNAKRKPAAHRNAAAKGRRARTVGQADERRPHVGA